MTDAVEAHSDSNAYDHQFYGILNKQGQFWSPMPFDSKEAAEKKLARYATGKNAGMLQTHKIVPVRVQLTALTGASAHD